MHGLWEKAADLMTQCHPKEVISKLRWEDQEGALQVELWAKLKHVHEVGTGW